MSVELAQSAGFCFGVDRAVSTVYRLLEEGKPAATLGPIIHNPQLVADLAARGVRAVSSPEETPPGHVLVIRSHGVPQSTVDRLEELGIPYVDATCPFVKKIHDLARRAGEEGKLFLLFGDAGHPEVQGIVGHCTGPYFICKNSEELAEALKNHPEWAQKPIAVAAQTTYHTGEWQICLETLKKVCTNAAVFATICNATAKRQKEAEALAAGATIWWSWGAGIVPTRRSSGRSVGSTVRRTSWKERKSCRLFPPVHALALLREPLPPQAL